MKRSKKLLLTVLMLLTLVFAASITTQAATAAKIGNKKYSSLQKAVNAVKNGQTIKVTKDITVGKSGSIEINKKGVSFTIDFQKHTCKEDKECSESCLLAVESGAVTLKNANMIGDKYIAGEIIVNKGAKLTITDGSYKKMCITNSGTLTITGGTLTGSETNATSGEYPLIGNYNALKVTGGTFKGEIYNGGKATIKGGKFTGYASVRVISNGKASSMTITGGTFTYSRGYVLYNRGSMTVKGGNFTSTYKNGHVIGICSGSMTKLKGGTFKGKSYLYGKVTSYNSPWIYADFDVSGSAVIRTPYIGDE